MGDYTRQQNHHLEHEFRNKIVNPFDQFMETVRVHDKNSPFTHTSMEGGKYYIDDNHIDEFYQLYHDTISDEHRNRGFSIVERHEGKEYFPLICDLDLKYNSDENKGHCYNVEFVRNFLIKFMVVIERFLVVTEPLSKRAFVLEKLVPTDAGNGLWKDGLHIVFPYIVTNSVVQEYIREDLIKETEDLFDKLSPSIVNTVEDAIDKSILRANGWMLYGSKKPNVSNEQKYALHSPYLSSAGIWQISQTSAEIIPPKDCDIYADKKKLITLMSIRKSTVYDSSEITDLGNAIINEGDKSKLKKQKEELKNKYVNSEIYIDTQGNFEYAKKLVDILNPIRAESYQSWIELGWCLHNIDFRLLDTWISFSKRCIRYEATAENECTDKWIEMRQHGLNIGTLCFWAEMDDRPSYLKLRETTYEGLIRECCSSIKMTEKSAPKNINDSVWYIVRVMKKMYEHLYVCSCYDRREWWDFNGNLWQRSDGGILLRQAIPNEVYSAFNKAYLIYNEKTMKMDPNTEAFTKNKNLARSALFIAEKLRNLAVRKNIMEEAAEAFHWMKTDGINFEEKLDSNNKLIGMKNKVYDLEHHCIREGRCDDYISISTNNEFTKYDWDHPVIKEIMVFVGQVLPNKNVRDYVLKTFASCLDGSTGKEAFYIFLGCGGNGKSKLVELMKLSLGGYAGTLSVSAITQTRPPSNAPTPELARLKGIRFVDIQEPNEREKLQTGRVKELTGGDVIVARSLNKEPIEYKPQFKLFLSCNHCPKVPPDDGGIWRRIKLINFTSKFVDNPNPNDPTEFHRDYDLQLKFEVWKEGFFWLLTEYYKYIVSGCPEKGIQPGLSEPDEIKNATSEYRHKNDFIQQFLDYCVKDDATGFVPLDSGDGLWENYKYYAKQSSQIPLQKQEFVECIENKYGTCEVYNRMRGWRRHRILDPEDRGVHNKNNNENENESLTGSKINSLIQDEDEFSDDD